MNKILPIKDYSIYSNRMKSRWYNDGFRNLYESIVPREHIMALDDWKENCINKCVLIDGLVYGYYNRPRNVSDMDITFLTNVNLGEVKKFKKIGNNKFIHNKTKTEIKTVSIFELGKDNNTFNIIINKSIESCDIKVASPSSVIYFQLLTKCDIQTIFSMYNHIFRNNINLDISDYNLLEDEKDTLNELILELDHQSIIENHQTFDLKEYIEERKKVFEVDKYKIILFEDLYGEPKFIFTEKFYTKISKFDEFIFAVSLTKPFNDDGRIRVVLSSTGYRSFTKFKKEEEILSEWLKDNIEMLREEWNKINVRKI